MSLLQKFKQFLTDELKGGGLTLDFIITAEERKALIREHLTPVIEKELQMTQVADFIWASEYNGMGMRKVLSFFHINLCRSTPEAKLCGREQIKVFIPTCMKCQRTFTMLVV